jgi:hypothetical protein
MVILNLHAEEPGEGPSVSSSIFAKDASGKTWR